MTQALNAHMNNNKKKKLEEVREKRIG
jgi:hypothetical protein